jgi:hypothetical protein
MKGNDFREEEDCGEVVNRFSINEENIVPLCILAEKNQ